MGYWAVRALGWLGVILLVYLSLVLFVLGPTIGPRGDIDYVDFSDAKKHAADIQATITQVFGIVPLMIAGLLALYNRRIATTLVDHFCKRR